VAGELRKSEVELMAGSAQAEKVWKGGASVSSSSPVFGCAAAVFWGFVAGSWRGDGKLGCGDSLGAEARKRWEDRALPRVCHGGGEVAATEIDRAAWRGEDGSSAGWSGARGLRGCRVWRWPALGGLPALPRRRAVPLCAGGRGSREGERREMKAGLVCNF
jgi:hypothetical protein